MIERVAPAILELLADGVPRPKAAIVAALAGRHAEADVALALVRLAVTGQVEQTGSKYTLGRRARTGRPRPPDPRRSPGPLRALLGAAGCRGHAGSLPPADRRSWAPWRPGAGLLRRDRRRRCRHRGWRRLRPRHLVGRPRRRLRDGTHRRPPSAGSASMVLRGPVPQGTRPRAREAAVRRGYRPTCYRIGRLTLSDSFAADLRAALSGKEKAAPFEAAGSWDDWCPFPWSPPRRHPPKSQSKPTSFCRKRYFPLRRRRPLGMRR